MKSVTGNLSEMSSVWTTTDHTGCWKTKGEKNDKWGWGGGEADFLVLKVRGKHSSFVNRCLAHSPECAKQQGSMSRYLGLQREVIWVQGSLQIR